MHQRPGCREPLEERGQSSGNPRARRLAPSAAFLLCLLTLFGILSPVRAQTTYSFGFALGAAGGGPGHFGSLSSLALALSVTSANGGTPSASVTVGPVP